MARPTPDPVYMLRGSDSAITALSFIANRSANQETVLASGNLNGCVQLWDLKKTFRCVNSLTLDEGNSVLWIEEVPSNGDLITQSRAGRVVVWARREDSFANTGSFRSGSLGFCAGCLVNTATGSPLIAVPSPENQSQVDIIDIDNNVTVSRLKPPEPSNKQGMCMVIKPVSREPDVSQILIGYESGSIILWDVKAQKIVDTFKAHPESVMSLDYCSGKNIGISGSTDTTLSAWTITADGKIQHKKNIEITNAGVNGVVVRRDEKLFVTAGWDGRIRVFGLKKLSPLTVLTSHSDSVQCLAFSSDNMLVCGSKDKRISLWDIYK